MCEQREVDHNQANRSSVNDATSAFSPIILFFYLPKLHRLLGNTSRKRVKLSPGHFAKTDGRSIICKWQPMTESR